MMHTYLLYTSGVSCDVSVTWTVGVVALSVLAAFKAESNESTTGMSDSDVDCDGNINNVDSLMMIMLIVMTIAYFRYSG